MALIRIGYSLAFLTLFGVALALGTSHPGFAARLSNLAFLLFAVSTIAVLFKDED